jgi:hypothetical protein
MNYVKCVLQSESTRISQDGFSLNFFYLLRENMEPGRLRRESDIVQVELQRDLGSIPINIIFTLLQNVQTGSGSHPASYSTSNRGSVPRSEEAEARS